VLNLAHTNVEKSESRRYGLTGEKTTQTEIRPDTKIIYTMHRFLRPADQKHGLECEYYGFFMFSFYLFLRLRRFDLINDCFKYIQVWSVLTACGFANLKKKKTTSKKDCSTLCVDEQLVCYIYYNDVRQLMIESQFFSHTPQNAVHFNGQFL
jgi:hypothetical protein